MKQITEAKIQQEIFIDYHNKNPTHVIHSVPNGGKRDKAEARAMALTGTVAGIADLIIHIPNGICIMVEVKTDKGIQSDAQTKIEKKIKAMNGNYILVRSLSDFWEKLNALKL